MTIAPPVTKVVEILKGAGYRSREKPFTVSTIPFEFDALFAGAQRSNDLIAVIDTLNEKEERIRQKVDGLSRALDMGGSRRPLTVVLVGPRPSPAAMESLGRVSRVLAVGTPTGPGADASLQDSLAVLLPLKLPEQGETTVKPLQETRERVSPSKDEGALTDALMEAAPLGAEGVREVLKRVLTETFAIASEQQAEGDAT